MADIEIVIKIPMYIYQEVLNNKDTSNTIIYKSIINGTPLPKGHGRLIDADAFRLYCFRKNWDRRLSAGGLATINMYLDSGAPTIIEADKGDKE